MINSRLDACSILGIPVYANDEEIKTAYKRLVKIYHPDSGNVSEVAYYHRIVEAYEFLRTHRAPPKRKTRIIGYTADIENRQAEREQFQRWEKVRKQQKKEAFERRIELEKEKERKQKENYEKAMKAINDIIMAERIKAMLKNAEEEKE